MSDLWRTSQDRRQEGFSLIELMVALTLSLVLLAGVIQVFLGSRQTFRMQEALSRIQENGRYATLFITREGQQAGFLGCADPSTVQFHDNVDITKASYSGDPSQFVDFDGTGAVDGYDDVAAASDTSVLGNALSGYGLAVGTSTGQVRAGTDVLALRRAGTCDGGGVVFTGLGNTYRYTDNANIKIEDAASCGITQDSIVLVTNCSSADMFGVTNNPQSGGSKDTLAHGSSLNATPKLQGEYGPGSEIYNLRSVVFYVGTGGSGEPALFRRHLNTDSTTVASEEMVPGVEDMQVRYGEDTDGDRSPDYYVRAGSITDIEQVVAVRIAFLVRSGAQRLTQAPQTYTYDGATVTASDRRLRKVFTTTIALRNRLK
ncbi:MAG TPA: PilW family protein [Gammaproteobacteria bacterium]|nr:PilW family protein [Gammaproteobacteria bacterium]